MDNKINFKEFKEIIEKMRDITDAEDNINKICSDLNFKYKECSEAGHLPNMVSDVIFLLEKLLDDKEQCISYWVFEKDFGRNLKLGDVSEADGTPIPMTTIEELWNYVTHN